MGSIQILKKYWSSHDENVPVRYIPCPRFRYCFWLFVKYVQYKSIKYNTIHYNTKQLNTIQHNTLQHNTIQYSFHLEAKYSNMLMATWFKSYEHFHLLITNCQTYAQRTLARHKGCKACQWPDNVDMLRFILLFVRW